MRNDIHRKKGKTEWIKKKEKTRIERYKNKRKRKKKDKWMKKGKWEMRDKIKKEKEC